MATSTIQGKIETYLGAKAGFLLGFKSPKIAKERLHPPGPDFVDRIYAVTDRNYACSQICSACIDTAALAARATSRSCPSDQGIEHSGGASFAKNPDYFDGGNICETGGRGRLQRPSLPPSVCSALLARKYASQNPFIVKINHNELLTATRTRPDQILFGTVPAGL